MKKVLLALAAVFAMVSCAPTDPEETSTDPEETSFDGRWNAPRFSDQPNDYAFSLVFKGDNLDLYILAWGQHYVGKYTFANDEITFNISKVYQAYTDVTYDNEHNMVSYSWNAGNLNPDDFSLAEGYDWYEMTGEDYQRYKEELSKFDFKVSSNNTAKSNLFGIEDLLFTKAK